MAWFPLGFIDFGGYFGPTNDSTNSVNYEEVRIELYADAGLPTPPASRMRFTLAEQPFYYDASATPFGGPPVFVAFTEWVSFGYGPFIRFDGPAGNYTAVIVEDSGTYYAIVDIVAETGDPQIILDWNLYLPVANTTTAPFVTAVEYEVLASNFWEDFVFSEEIT